MKPVLLCLVFLIFVNVCTANAEPGIVSVDIPNTAIIGQPLVIKIKTTGELPASSFYRVDIECPVKPTGAKINMETGIPESELVFSSPGKYECEIEMGYVTKSSCAGVKYTKLYNKPFSISITDN